MGKKGEIYTRKVPTVWYFWECAEKGCKMKPLRATVEKFVINGADKHMEKHGRQRETDAKMMAARLRVSKK